MALTDDDQPAEPEAPKVWVAVCVVQGVLDELFVCRSQAPADQKLLEWLELPEGVTIDQWFDAKAVHESAGDDLPDWWDDDKEDSTVWETPLH